MKGTNRAGSGVRWLAALGLGAASVACGGGGDDTGSGGGTHDGPGYCDVVSILEEKCVRCHADPPVHGAPFPLDTLERITQPAPGDTDGEPLYQRMEQAIETDFMPATWLTNVEPEVEELSEGEKELVLDWLSHEAPRGDGDCL